MRQAAMRARELRASHKWVGRFSLRPPTSGQTDSPAERGTTTLEWGTLSRVPIWRKTRRYRPVFFIAFLSPDKRICSGKQKYGTSGNWVNIISRTAESCDLSESGGVESAGNKTAKWHERG